MSERTYPRLVKIPPAHAAVRDLPAPPAELEPDAFAGRLYAMLEPLAEQDPVAGWSLLILCNSIGVMYELVEEWVRDTPDGPGWSLLLDLDRCPDEALPWLAQFAGVRVLPGSSPADMRARIASTDGFKRGTRAAMVGAAAATLTGAKTVLFVERSGDTAVKPEYAYYIDVTTYASQTPDPTATLNALLAQKPGGLVLRYQTTPGQTWGQLKSSGKTWAQVTAAYPTWDDVRNDQPA